MSTRRTRSSAPLARKLAELSLAVPQVVAHRVTRMALAGPSPTARDRQEFERMVEEKKLAFGQSWMAMGLQAVQAQQALALSMMRSFWSPASLGRRPPSAAAVTAAVTSQLQRAAVNVLGQGLAPVHRKAVANAKRLARTRLR